jgi:hypothetical protein
MAKITSPWIGTFPVLEGLDDNNNYKVEFSPMMCSVHGSVATSQLKVCLFPDKSMYSSECFARPGPIAVKGGKVCIVERIVDDRRKNECQ